MCTRGFLFSIRVTLIAIVVAGLCSVGTSFSQSPRRIFVTSAEGTADLSTWPDSGGMGGLAGADAICRARAQVAGLGNSSGFVAWMSDSSNDAYCRIHGLSGLKSANCGQSTLPVAAGPWVRIDGFPFSGDIEQLMEPHHAVLSPVLFDEFGDRTSALYFTATGADGELSSLFPVTCADWNGTPSEMVVVGSPFETAEGWTLLGTTLCNHQRRLLCMEKGPSTSLPPYLHSGAVVFVTSENGTGNLGSWPDAGGATGITAGDAICRTLAANAGLAEPMSFKAWLSDGATNAVDRLSFNGPWIRLDGVKIADTKADLTDGDLWTSINIDETGVPWFSHPAWTGTTALGSSSGHDCLGWTNSSDSQQGTQGQVNSAGDTWTDIAPRDCDSWWYHLYCFSEFPTYIFMDEFESGDLAGWTGATR